MLKIVIEIEDRRVEIDEGDFGKNSTTIMNSEEKVLQIITTTIRELRGQPPGGDDG